MASQEKQEKSNSPKEKLLFFISPQFLDIDESFIHNHSKKGSRISSVLYSKAVFESLKEYYSKSVALSIFPVSWWPKYSNLLFVRGSTSHDDLLTPSFINFIGIRNFSIEKNLWSSFKKKYLNKLKKSPPKAIDIVITEAWTPELRIAEKIKKALPNSKILQIVPDLPFLTNPNRNLFYRLLKIIDANLFVKSAKRCIDAYMLFSPYMVEFLKDAQHKPTIISGPLIRRPITPNYSPGICSSPCSIVYTGCTSERYSNINQTIRITQKLETDFPNIHLTIAGNGDNEKKLQEISKADPHISYIGRISSSEASELQQKAGVLVNLRPNTPDFRYSFASKNIEYLATGKPTIISRLDYIPEDIKRLFFYPEGTADSDVEEIFRHCLTLTSDQRTTLANSAHIVAQNYSPQLSAKKIVDLLNKK